MKMFCLFHWEVGNGAGVSPESYSTDLKTIAVQQAIKMALEAAFDVGEQGALCIHTQRMEE